MALSRDQLLSAPDLQSKELQVPEWGDSVVLKQLDVAGLLAFERLRQGVAPAGLLSILAALSLANEDGTPMFTGDEAAHALSGKNLEVVARLGSEALTLNRMGAEDDEARVKNS